jgi:OOP family OmpA-OmpF porin
MHFKIKKTITRVSVLSALLPTLPWLAADALAHDRVGPPSKIDPAKAPARGSYAYDSYSTVVRSGFTRECVATGFWTWETATQECHPDYFAAALKPAPQAAAEPQAAPAEYEAAQYSEPPDYEPAQYAEPEPEMVPEGEPEGMLPVPSPDSFAAEEADDRISEPVTFYDEEEGVVADETILGTTVYGDDDSGITPDDGIVSQQFYDEEDEGAVADDGIIGRREFDDFTDEPVAAAEEPTGFPEFVDETAEAADEPTGFPEFVDEPAAVAEEPSGFREFVDEPPAVAEEPTEIREFTDEPVTAADEPYIAPEFYDEEVADEDIEPFAYAEEEQEPEATISEPTVEPEEAAISEPTVQPEEAVVAQAEEPAPAKPIVLPVTITLDAEALFDFDRSLVRSNDRMKLDNLVNGLQGVDYDTVVVVGHADRIGTQGYNQRLSERRAAAVKSYLVNKGVPADRIQTEGRGEFEPATDPQACQGMRKQTLIDCLQPDRRVEVTVTGQKPR